MTVTDREIENAVLALHECERPPATRHLLAHVPVASEGADASDHRDTIFDPSLPPAMSPGRSAVAGRA